MASLTQFQNDVSSMRNEFLRNAPFDASFSVSKAKELMQEYKEAVAGVRTKEGDMKAGLDVFNIEPPANQETADTEKNLELLATIWGEIEDWNTQMDSWKYGKFATMDVASIEHGLLLEAHPEAVQGVQGHQPAVEGARRPQESRRVHQEAHAAHHGPAQRGDARPALEAAHGGGGQDVRPVRRHLHARGRARLGARAPPGVGLVPVDGCGQGARHRGGAREDRGAVGRAGARPDRLQGGVPQAALGRRRVRGTRG